MRNNTIITLFVGFFVTYFVLIPSLVVSDDTISVPSDKSQINSWFQANIKGYNERKATLDPPLAEAEASPKIIKLTADGSGEFKTIGDAIKSIPEGNKNRVIISLGPGNYTEKIKIERTKPFISFVGDPKNVARIIFGGTAAEYGTVESATLIVESDYFSAANIVIMVGIFGILLYNLSTFYSFFCFVNE